MSTVTLSAGTPKRIGFISTRFHGTDGVSLEARVPFLDHKFVELALSIPEAVKTRNGTLKHMSSGPRPLTRIGTHGSEEFFTSPGMKIDWKSSDTPRSGKDRETCGNSPR